MILLYCNVILHTVIMQTHWYSLKHLMHDSTTCLHPSSQLRLFQMGLFLSLVYQIYEVKYPEEGSKQEAEMLQILNVCTDAAVSCHVEIPPTAH